MKKIKKIKRWTVRGYDKDGRCLGQASMDAFDRKGAVEEARYFRPFGNVAVKITAVRVK